MSSQDGTKTNKLIQNLLHIAIFAVGIVLVFGIQVILIKPLSRQIVFSIIVLAIISIPVAYVLPRLRNLRPEGLTKNLLEDGNILSLQYLQARLSTLGEERELWIQERLDLLQERELWIQERSYLQARLSTLGEERELWIQERADLLQERELWIQERSYLQARLSTLGEERELWIQERADLQKRQNFLVQNIVLLAQDIIKLGKLIAYTIVSSAQGISQGTQFLLNLIVALTQDAIQLLLFILGIFTALMRWVAQLIGQRKKIDIIPEAGFHTNEHLREIGKNERTSER